MKALVYHGPGHKAWEDVPAPTIQDPTDVIAKVDTTTICGTDLHILKGDVPAVTDGRILGHEAIGTITEVGAAVTGLAVGDRIIIPAVTNCGKCSYCRNNQPSHCQTLGGVGWVFGHLVDGTQAEYVRVPFAETSVHQVPEGLDDEDVLFLTDALPTGFEIGILNGSTKPGDTVAIVGAGPVGLGAVMTANLCGAGRVITVDLDENRMDKALELGATDKVDAGDPDAVERIRRCPRTGSAWTWPSRPSGSRRRSGRAWTSCGPTGPWPTPGCTASRSSCRWTGCGSPTSGSPRASSTAGPWAACSTWSAPAGSTRRRWPRTASRCPRWRRPTTCSATPRSTGR